jgi:hypothetical protein
VNAMEETIICDEKGPIDNIDRILKLEAEIQSIKDKLNELINKVNISRM